jgi:hypothetical protein
MKRILLLFTFISISSIAFAQGLGMITPPERSRFSMHARFGLLTNNPDLMATLYQKSDTTIFRTITTGAMAAPELILNFDIVRYRAMNIGLQVSAIAAQPGLHVKDGNGGDYLAGITDLYMAKGTLWFSFNTSGEPYSLFSMPYHGQGESVIGFTGMFAETMDIAPTKAASDSLGITNINGNTCRAIGVQLGWNWRLGQSGWVFGIHGSLMWELDKNYLINFETSEEAGYKAATLPFAPRLITGGFGYHF